MRMTGDSAGREATVRARLIGTSGMTLAVLLASSASLAGTSGNLKLAGRVPPRASIWLSSWSMPSVRLQPAAQQRYKLADFVVSANSKQFTISLVSANADAAGTPMLVDTATGAAMAYNIVHGLTDAAADAALSGGNAVTTADQRPLEILLPKLSEQASGSFQDRLLLVIKAR